MMKTTTLLNTAAWQVTASPDATVALNAKVGITDGPVGMSYDYYTGKVVTNAASIFYPAATGITEYTRQWHLTRLGNIASVWNDFTGQGVSVGVYDSGVESAHWDLAGNYDASKHVVIDGVALSGEPMPDSGGHGTAVAGLIAGVRNDRGGVGVAFDAQVTGVNIFTASLPINVNGDNDRAFFSAMNQANQFDVVNHSWGDSTMSLKTEDSRGTEGTFENALAKSFAYIAETGRDGLGTITVSAAGNDSRDQQSEGSKTDRHNIAVSAYREIDGVSSYYTSYGPHVLVAGPSDDYFIIGGTGLVTTDLLGANGYNMDIDTSAASDYTDLFGGTSGATPIVTGVVSLILDANEGLGWRDVKNILAASAKMPIAFETGPIVYKVVSDDFNVIVSMNESQFRLAGQAAGWNGGTMHYSNDYGYGAVDAYNAVRMAEVWSLFGPAKTSANEAVVTTGVVPVNLTADSDIDAAKLSTIDAANDIVGTPTRFTFEVKQSVDVEHIDLTLNYLNTLDISYLDSLFRSYSGTMFASQLKLIAPDGTVGFTYQDGGLDTVHSAGEEFVFGFSGFRGVETKGTWTLEFQSLDVISDMYSPGTQLLFDNALTINSLKMDIFGSEVTNDDVFTYTNEFFTMAAIDGEVGRRVLSDTDGGIDWINAAAVSSDIKLSLVAGQATNFGDKRAFTIDRTSMIEGAVTGDGNDTLVGSRFDNHLYGMRGNDTLNGGAGNDFLFGGKGSDRFQFDNRGTSGKDTILDWSVSDMIGTQTALRGASSDGKVTVANNTFLLLDGLLTGDTVSLSQNGGAVLQAMGQKDGYFWYSYLSGANLDPNDVIREVSFQPERTAAGAVDVIAATGTATAPADVAPGDLGMTLAGPMHQDNAFYLYDPMAGSMSAGVQLYA